MNTAVNGSSCTNWLNPTAEKIVKTSVYSLTFVVSLLGNTFITIVVYRTQALKKPINFFYRQHGHFRPAVSNIHVSTKSNTVVRGFRLRLCQWSFWSCFVQADRVFTKCVRCCVYSEPGSDSSGPFWSCGISLPFPTHRFKAVRLFHSRHVDHRDGRQLAIHC